MDYLCAYNVILLFNMFCSVSGDWFLQTSGEPPYSLGNDGLSYSQPAGEGLVKTVVNALSQVVQEVVGLVL